MKRRLVGVFLAAFAVWPLVQHALVVRYGVDPWKLFGWAMYSAPGPMKTVRIARLSREAGREQLDFRGYAPEEQRAVDRFRERRRALGRLQTSDALAAAFLELHPDWEGVEVAVLTLALDPADARLRADVERRAHWRDPATAPPSGR